MTTKEHAIDAPGATDRGADGGVIMDMNGTVFCPEH